MVIDEALKSVSSIPDPYVRIVTYGRIGVSLAKAKDPRYEQAFKLAFEELAKIEDPYLLLKSLLVIGYSTSLAGFKSSKKAFREVIINSEVLPPRMRDEIRAEAVKYLVLLKDIDEALFYALDIKNKKLRNEKILEILTAALEDLKGDKINIVYKKKKIELILEAIEDEPYKSEAIVKTIRPLLSVGDYRLVMELIQEIKSKPWIRQALNELLLYLKQENSENVKVLINFSLELANKLKDDIREDLAYIFAIHGFIDNSIVIIRELQNPKFILEEIFETLILKDTEKLRNFINALPVELLSYIKDQILELLKSEDEKIKPIVDALLRKEGITDDVIVGAIKYYLTINKLEEAMRAVNLLKSPKSRSIALGFLAHYLIKIGNVSDAIDIVLNIRDRKLASRLASEILVKVVEGEINESAKKKDPQRERPVLNGSY
ncbi:hypothetical protein [Pyrococcus sp. ST04]|uniref:hypothetical protein n=1 Tax=Pyrococcus sp. ST04 TaxID=1183377 RepID=UPI0002605D40|nr:hypothetical protein [Pyrococcus sp. ST04]AFK22457.1 hypothetical protein Py04_0865 [Pyrococcus sp. ST04]